MSTAWKPNAEDGEVLAIDYAESQFTQTASMIEAKVSKDGIVSALNITPEEVKISSSKINLDGFVEAKHIKSLDGLTIGSKNELVIDSLGNATFAGTLNGADGDFQRFIGWRKYYF